MIEALLLFFFYGLLLEFLRALPELLYGLVVEILCPFIKFMVWATARVLSMSGRFIWALLVFFYYLADEALRRRAEPEETDWQYYEDTEVDEEDSYEEALILLGLQEDCSQKEFIRAFRSAMAQAHPDKGGTHEQALAINKARKIVKNHKGWR